MGIHRADADLDQPVGQPLLHDPGKRTGMRIPVPVERIVQIRMGVKVQDVQFRIPAGQTPDRGE